jgi:serine phosphatase RsbU (regulator of sigma subunit)
VALVEVFYHSPQGQEPECLLSFESNIWWLVQSSGGSQLALSDLMFWKDTQNQRAYQALKRAQEALEISLKSQAQQRSEIEAAQRVLEQRTQALFSLQSLGQALISSDDLSSLGKRICRRASELCGGELAVLYYLRQEQAEVLAVNGWPLETLGKQVPAIEILNWSRSAEPAPYQGIPPGVVPDAAASAAPLHGLYVPLIAQQGRVGALVLQTTKGKGFQPGEIALLQTFANQAALALQRADLVGELVAKIKELEVAQTGLAQKERMEREMELARQVQKSFLPRSFPAVAGLSFAARYEAANHVGGDFYDVIALPDGSIGLAIADVSDKGMPAALYMALTRSLLHAEAQRQSTPAEVLRRINQILHDLGSSSMFVTIFYGTLDPTNGKLRYARAGHDRPVILRNGKAMELEGRGQPLGIFIGPEFYLEEHSVILEGGESLVMYSDGLTDAHSPGGDLFERHRLLALLEEKSSLPPEELCAQLFERVLNHQQGSSPFDDMTLLIVQRALAP